MLYTNLFTKASELLFFLFILIFLASCQQSSEPTDYILSEKDLIPEGVAFDIRSNTIYVGGTYKRKIVQIDAEGKISDFIPQEMDGIWSPLGMEVDPERDILWLITAHINEVLPLIHPDTSIGWRSNITAIDISERKILKTYELFHAQAAMNDLTVLPNGDVYATESVNNAIYRISSSTDTLEKFLQTEGLQFLNGITYSPEPEMLFVSSVEGILKVNLASRDYTLLSVPDSIKDKGIDGLTYQDGYLIGHRDEIYQYYLNKEHTAISHVELIDSGPEFDASTTGEIGNGYYHYIVNSQIQSGVDYELRTVKPLDSLENVIIRKRKI